jgi:Zn-dependent metalloprotease
MVGLLSLVLPGELSAQYVDPQFQDLERLRSRSAAPVAVDLRNGIPRTLGCDVPATGANPVERARGFLDDFAVLYRQNEPDPYGGPDTTPELELKVRGQHDETILDVVAFHQTVGGIPVYGGRVVVGLTKPGDVASRVVFTSGHLMSADEIDLVPAITPEMAADAARDDLGRAGAPVIGEPELMVFDPQAIAEEAPPRLAWAVTVGGGEPWQLLVDAHTEEVVHKHGLVKTDGGHPSLEDYDLYFQDANGANAESTSCYYLTADDDVIGDEDGIISEYENDPEAVAEWWHLRNTYLFYHDTFGRHSWDNDDAEMEVYVYAGTEGCANWNGSCELIQFEEGCVSFDVTVHEFGHAVITFSPSDFDYYSESGALEESFCDTMGALADHDDWLVGEDRTNGEGAIRSMENPTFGLCGPPGARHFCGQPDRYSDFECVVGDYCGVHHNSGIMNKAAYLMAEGGSFNGVDVGAGMGRHKMGQLLYFSLRFLWNTAQFADARNLAVFTADLWARGAIHGFTAADACTVRNAYHAVEVGAGDRDCDGVGDELDDSDSDGVVDLWDNCDTVPNPAQHDYNHDGQGDACDPDSDQDGCPDALDNCPGIHTPCSPPIGPADYDDDGVGNVCDWDDDNDGVHDIFDNCRYDPNPDQYDGNGDGRGDACDPDHDGDGAYSDTDNCPYVANADLADSDEDGIGDACDKCPDTPEHIHAYHPGFPELGIEPFPWQPDSDGDGTPDACDGFPFGDVAMVVDGQNYNPTVPLAPDGVPRVVEIAGPGGGSFRIPLPVCWEEDEGVLDPDEAVEYRAVGMSETTEVWVSDEAGRRVTGLSDPVLVPGTVPVWTRGFRFRPDCSRRYFLEFLIGAGAWAEVFSLTGDTVDASGANPWSPPGSGLPEPPAPQDTDGDGIFDNLDNCVNHFNPIQEDTDGDGRGDACDKCFGEDSTGDHDFDRVCADLDCDDEDPFERLPDACGRCDGRCIFADGFESWSTDTWSVTVP